MYFPKLITISTPKKMRKNTFENRLYFRKVSYKRIANKASAGICTIRKRHRCNFLE
ncbi:hypothetical protein HMPREF1881_00458 [Streptococcus agalactiae]|nr:hypothetical protein HMPREF1881_00458 [Streptococcus agalactiae]